MYKKIKIIHVALFFGLLRCVLLFVHNPNLLMNYDEESNYEVATNHFHHKGYTYHDPEKGVYIPTAFHGSFTIFVYEHCLIQWNIHKRYWVILCNLVSALLLGISICYFHKIAVQLMSVPWATAATLCYCLFPSVLYYIGTLFWYEQIVLSVLIIVWYLILKSVKQKLSFLEIAVLLTSILSSTLFRLQTIAILMPVLLILLIYFAYKKQKQQLLVFSAVFLLGILVQIPSLTKNKELFGAHVLSTQMGFELLQGHNPYSKGSWMGNFLLPSSDLYQYAHQHIPNINELNEYEEGLARKQLALKWIKEQPLAEIRLIARKVALYFLPRNFEFLPFHQLPNPVNLLVYLGFIFYLVMLLLKKITKPTLAHLLLITPVAGSLLLTVIFFMGARWRYYAEPFMIIFAFILFEQISAKRNLFKK